jgi:hypothetical protein
MTPTEMITAEDVAQELLLDMPVPLSSASTSDEQPAVSVQTNPYIGIASAPFSTEAAEVLMQEIPDPDIEIRPDGLIYLPEIKYRRILNRAFGPGAWSLLPMDITVASGDNMLYYRGALFVHGRFVSEAIGEQQYFANNDRMSYATAAESAKSNCLMRCCKDLGIASELWDPTFVRRWIAEYATEVWCTNVGNGGDRGKKRKMWRKKTAPAIDMYPWKEEGPGGNGAATNGVSVPTIDNRSAAVHEPVERMTVSRTPVEQSAPVVTFRQVKRFQAIAGEKGWSADETQRLLAHYGYSGADAITRSDYEKVCMALENPELLAEIRRSRTGARQRAV